MKCYMQAEKYDWGIQMYHEYVKCLRRDLDEEPSHAGELLFRTMFHRKEVSLIRKTDRKDHFFDGWRSFNTLMNGFSGS